MRPDQTGASEHFGRQTQFETFGDETFVIIQITLSLQRGNISNRNSVTKQTVLERFVKKVDVFVARPMNLGAESDQLPVPRFNKSGDFIKTWNTFAMLLQQRFFLLDDSIVVGKRLRVWRVEGRRAPIDEITPRLGTTAHHFPLVRGKPNGLQLRP